MKVVIDGQESDTHSLNAGVPQGSVLGPTLFLIFINDDLPGHILRSFIDIFADDTTRYDSTNSRRDQTQLAADLTSNLDRISDWGVKWLIVFNASKTKLLSFHHHRGSPVFPDIFMNGESLDEQQSLDRLLGLKFTSNLKWSSYIRDVAKDVSKMIGSFFRSRRYLTPQSILYLYKSQIRPKMELKMTFLFSTGCKIASVI